MKPALKASLLKFALIGVLFYTSYGLSNHYAASLAYVPGIAFAWERSISFWAWTIVPYWSLNPMYVAVFFLCRNACEQNCYVARLLAAQIVAAICFTLLPLHFGWPKPLTDGSWGWLFGSSVASDLSYNQAPSLHTTSTVIAGAFYWMRFPKVRLLIFLWQSLTVLSVLTTYQHHFIDVPTGALLGWLVLWAIPQHGVPPFRRSFGTQGRLRTSEASFCEAKTNAVSFARTSEASFREARASPETRSREIKTVTLYLAGVISLALPSLFSGAWLWTLWVSTSLSVVAFAYLTDSAAVFQKQADGRLSAAATVSLLSYLAGVRLNTARWLSGKAKIVQARDGVWIGSTSGISDNLSATLDVCAEYPCPRHRGACCVLPLLDMAAPSENDLVQAALLLEVLRRQHGKVLTCCALGYGRSATAALTWLLVYGGYRDLAQATAELKQARLQMMLPSEVAKAVEVATGYPKTNAVSFAKTSEMSSSEAKTDKTSLCDINRDS